MGLYDINNLKTALKNIGKTQIWLAKELGVTPPSVHTWITGATARSVIDVSEVASLLGISFWQLYGSSVMLLTHKQCHRCNNLKPISSFHTLAKKGGYPWCDCCRKKYQVTYDPHYRKKHFARLNKQTRYRRKFRGYSERETLQKRRHNLKHPDRYKARSIATNAIHKGTLKRKANCQSCGVKGKTEVHHPDYSAPLEVIFLCRKCHLKEHGKELMVVG